MDVEKEQTLKTGLAIKVD